MFSENPIFGTVIPVIEALGIWMNDPENQEFIRDAILGKEDENGERKPWIDIKGRVNLNLNISQF